MSVGYLYYIVISSKKPHAFNFFKLFVVIRKLLSDNRSLNNPFAGIHPGLTLSAVNGLSYHLKTNRDPVRPPSSQLQPVRPPNAWCKVATSGGGFDGIEGASL